MEDLFLKIVSVLIILFLHSVLSTIMWFSIKKNPATKITSLKQVRNKILSVMYIVIASVLFIIFAITHILGDTIIFYDEQNEIHDIPNWITLIVEIAIGIAIAIIILFITQFSDKENADDIKGAVKQQSTAPPTTFKSSTDNSDSSKSTPGVTADKTF